MTQAESAVEKNLIWRVLSSVKLTFGLLISLAVFAIVGTVIPQQEGVGEFARRLSPGMLQFFKSLDLFNMYHSLWFRILLALLTLNLLVCSFDRFPGTWRVFKARPKPDRMRPFENLSPDRSFTVKGELDHTANRAFDLLKGHFKKIQTKRTPKGRFLYGEKGRYSYFGVYLVHFSILIILMGAIVGSLWGFEGYVNIPEGGAVNSFTLREGKVSKGLGFIVHLDKFMVEFYDTGAPKEYESDLRFFAGNREIMKGSLRVNHPITVRGITFYQSSYGSIPGESVSLKLSRKGGKPEVTKLVAKKGSPLQLPGGEGQFEVIRIEKNLRGIMGPAAMISVKDEEGKKVSFWVFQDFESLRKRFPPAMLKSTFLNPSAFKPYTFFLEEIESRYYTGLQVAKDPGVPLVWLGCFVMVFGFFVAFFSSHKRVWVRVSNQDDKLEISVAGMVNKNPVGLERELDSVTQKLRHFFLEKG
jgi:cytochrome c biogenesis protein